MVGLQSLVKRLTCQPGPFLKASPGHPMLHNNDPPDEQQVLEIREEIRKLEMSYEKLTGRRWSPPADPSNSTKHPSSKVRKLDTQIHSLHTILSPIRRIPDEVLQEILFQAAMCSPYTKTVTGMRVAFVTPNQPRRLALVCRRWKRAVLDCHFLWQHLPLWVSLDARNPLPPQEQEKRIKDICTHFRLAGSLPVWLDIYQFGRHDSQGPGKEQVWKLLLENAARWGRVEVFWSYEIYERLQKDADGGKNFLQLTDVTFELDESWPAQPEGGPIRIDAFAQAPNLRNATFKSRTSKRGPKVSLVLPWPQLERYCSRGGGDDALDNILQANPKDLVYLDYIVATFYTNLPEHPVVLLKLQVLRVQACDNASQLAALLDRLVLPSLIELQLRGRFTQEDSLFTKVKNLVRRSGCSLRKLELDDGDTDITTFTQLLFLTPTLESLDITRPTDAMLAALILDPSSSDPILPKLSKLTIEISTKNMIPFWELEEDQLTYACDIQVLRAVLKSRMGIIGPSPGSFHDVDYFKTLTEFRLGYRGYYPEVLGAWDFQAKLEGPSTVPDFPDQRLCEWQMWFESRFTTCAVGKDLYNPKLHLAMHVFLRQVEKLEPTSEMLQLFTVSVQPLLPQRLTEHFLTV